MLFSEIPSAAHDSKDINRLAVTKHERGTHLRHKLLHFEAQFTGKLLAYTVLLNSRVAEGYYIVSIDASTNSLQTFCRSFLQEGPIYHRRFEVVRVLSEGKWRGIASSGIVTLVSREFLASMFLESQGLKP